MARRRPKLVLFVDDEARIHNTTGTIAKKLRIRARRAWHPDEARRILLRRATAIERQQNALRKKLESSRNAEERRRLRGKISTLGRMKKSPFDLVVQDINMPIGHPTGVQLAGDIRRDFPKQRVVVLSDDRENMEEIDDRFGIPGYDKLKLIAGTRGLEEFIRGYLKR
ncbi:MAG: hypothetical protein JXB14_03595 [Candidatus Altiarchaeota archaeon]|nr:hypothetical protein [Candidatus Altiarchaeota archaeon]